MVTPIAISEIAGIFDVMVAPGSTRALSAHTRKTGIPCCRC
ncbi:hypothetical protein [Bradyrhizobium sp. ORS 375]|nr:hypothetical protein [Bradyrhizobium sp. ORS 375]